MTASSITLRLGSSDRGPGSPEIRRNIDGASSTFLLEIEHNAVDYGRPNRLGQPVPRGTSYCRSLCPELDNARHLVRAPSWRVPCIVRGVEVAKVRSILIHRRGHLVLCFRHRRRKDALYRISRDDDRVCELHPEISGIKRSEEHTSELQSPDQLVCRLLLKKKNI